MLFERGINYNDVPMWQKRGIGVYGDVLLKDGFNPITKKTVQVKRNVLRVDYELPLHEEYAALIASLLN